MRAIGHIGPVKGQGIGDFQVREISIESLHIERKGHRAAAGGEYGWAGRLVYG